MTACYFNNAATSYPKPACVARAVAEALMRPPGDANRAGLTGRDAFGAVRLRLAERTRVADPTRFALGPNATWALNLALFGYPLKPGDAVLATDAEHNSVLRPLYALEKRGVRVVFAPVDAAGRVDPAAWERLAAEVRPRLCVFTHASNVTGALSDVPRLAEIAKHVGAAVLIDLSQTLGCAPVDIPAMGCDMAAFTGHKYLLGPQGTGGLYVAEGVALTPLLLGGTGVRSDLPGMPEEMPTHLEAGTGNEPSFMGLLAALDWARENPLDSDALRDLARRAREGLRAAGANVIDPGEDATPVVSFNIPGLDAQEAGLVLKENYDITCRTGLHCAPRIQSALGFARGGVRVSFSRFTTPDEVDYLTRAVAEVAAHV